jgi:DNA (cytosine-5)-methyltransferase 1
MTPVALEVFCGGGGVVAALLAAGFRRVICIDLEDHSRSLAKLGPGVEFHQMDWADGVARFASDAHLITGGPPCQRDSKMSNCRPGLAATYPDLLVPFREAIAETGTPYVIEQPDNPGARAKMRNPVMLCGTHFGLEAANDAGVLFGLQRHRLFESDVPLTSPGACCHVLPRLPVYGHGAPGNFKYKGTGMERAMRQGMGIGWMTRAELAEAIPRIYASYLIGQVLATDPRLARFELGGGWQDLAITAEPVLF